MLAREGKGRGEIWESDFTSHTVPMYFSSSTVDGSAKAAVYLSSFTRRRWSIVGIRVRNVEAG